LDAIHVATAASISAELGVLITHDRRMTAGARHSGTRTPDESDVLARHGHI
jgi:hypothetical protein